MTAPHNVRKSAQRELELSCDWISGCVKLFAPVEAPPNQEFVTQNTVQQTDQNLHVKGAQSVASWSLVLAGLVVGITVCVAIGYIVFLQPNPDSNVPNLPPSDTMVETPPDETSSTSLSLSPSSKPENASEATSVGLPARYIQNEPPS